VISILRFIKDEDEVLAEEISICYSTVAHLFAFRKELKNTVSIFRPAREINSTVSAQPTVVSEEFC